MTLADDLVMELLVTPEGRRHPYDRYRRLREIAPVHKGQGPMWFLTDHTHTEIVLRDPRMGRVEPGTPPGSLPGDNPPRSQSAFIRYGVVFLNPPDHTRLRGLISRVFTPSHVAALRPDVDAIVAQVVRTILDQREVDVMETLAFEVPIQIIGEMIGVPPADRHRFKAVVRDSAAAMEAGVTDEQIAAAASSMEIMEDYFRDFVNRRRTEPKDDLTSLLLSARDIDDRLTEDELIGTLILLYAAGFETTTNLLGNGVACLLEHPDVFHQLGHDPSLVPAAVEEMARLETPLQVISRTAFEPTEIDGRPVAPGDTVVMFLGAANRDPARYDSPDRLLLDRPPTATLAYSAGIHFCLGANLARLEGHTVFAALARHFRSLTLLDSELAWRGMLLMRGLEHLHVRFEPH